MARNKENNNSVKYRPQGRSFPTFFKTLRSLCLVLFFEGFCKIENQLPQQFSTGTCFPLHTPSILIFLLKPPEKSRQRETDSQKTHKFLLEAFFLRVGEKSDHNRAIVKT